MSPLSVVVILQPGISSRHTCIRAHTFNRHRQALACFLNSASEVFAPHKKAAFPPPVNQFSSFLCPCFTDREAGGGVGPVLCFAHECDAYTLLAHICLHCTWVGINPHLPVYPLVMQHSKNKVCPGVSVSLNMLPV